MALYIALFVVVLLSQLINHLRKKYAYKIKSKFVDKCLDLLFGKFVLVAILFVLFATIRSYSVGTDNLAYYTNYLKARQQSIKNRKNGQEIGYFLLCKFCSLIHLPYWCIQGIVMLCVVIAFFVLIEKYSKQKWLSWLMFLALGIYAQGMNIYREMIALSIVIFAFICLNRKDWKGVLGFIALVFIASLFHKSAFIALVYIPLMLIPLNWGTLALYIGGTAVLTIFFKPIVKFLSQLFHAEKFYAYVANVNSFFRNPGWANWAFTIGLFVIFLVMFIAKNKLVGKDKASSKWYSFLLSMFLGVSLLRFVGGAINYQMMLHRLTPYFFFTILILVPNFLFAIKDFNKKFYYSLLTMCIVGCLVYMYVLYGVHMSCEVVPYKFIWSK